MITRFFKRLYRIIDRILVVPISRAIYYLNKKFKKNQGAIDKILNKPHFLIYLSLFIAAGIFLLIDSKVINLVENEAEVISNVDVVVKYNEGAYVIEGVPKTVDITLSGRKSDIYLAKQLGDYEVVLDLTDYTPSENAYKVYFTYSKSINSLNYILNPSYVQVSIKNKEREVKTIDYELLNIDYLDTKLSVKSVTLSKNEVVVAGSKDALNEIATVKALIDLKKQDFTEAGTFDITNVELVAYDSTGNKMDNIEIVPDTIDASIVLDSYSVTVPLSINTTGKLVPGKSIASILINGNSGYSITIYGDKSDIEKITSIPVTINVNDAGGEATKTYNATINKPNGVRSMSTSNVTITLTFGDETQKTMDLGSISFTNLADGLAVNSSSGQNISVQAKGVKSVIDGLEQAKVKPYVDLEGYSEGEYEVEIQFENNNPLVNYVASSKLKIIISKK